MITLPLAPAQLAVVLELIDGLTRISERVALVGGLVPPILLQHLDPDGYEAAATVRATADFDIAVDLALTPDAFDELETMLRGSGWTANRQQNQFRWCKDGAKVDVMPVPAGIERGAESAVAVAARFQCGDPHEFFRGYEFALQEPVTVEISALGNTRSLTVAGVVSLLAMKLQARLDRRADRKRDARDVGWLLRYMATDVVVAELRRASLRRDDLVEFVVARLASSFTDADADGCMDYGTEAHGLVDEYTEPHREAVAAAVRRLLDAYRRS